MNQHQRLIAETEAEKQVRLEQLKMNQQNCLCNETLVDKEARLENKKQRLQAETLKNSLSKLERMSTRQRERLEMETPEQRSARLAKTYMSKQNSSDGLVPLLNDECFKEKTKIFHESMSSIESPICSICLEHFPGTQMASNCTECRRCFRDKKIPKLFSAENNMSPGPVPAELQVSNFIIYNTVIFL